MSDRSKLGIPATFSGAHWRATHQATVEGVLVGTRLTRPVVSRGSEFSNHDHWSALRFADRMLRWVELHPGLKPTYKEVADWCSHANHRKQGLQPHIVIAHTPDKLTHRVALALDGGACHEGWHTRFSRRRAVKPDEMAKLVLPGWERVEDWSSKVRMLQELFGYVEDVRIERLGVKIQPATKQPMRDLQDFVLAQEQRARLVAQAHGMSEADCFTPVGVAFGTLRDLGLGYNTPSARHIMALRKQYQPEIVELVQTVLRPLLDEIIELGNDDLGFIRKSMDVVVALQEYADQMPEQSQGAGPQGELACPNCGAPPEKLRLHPKRVDGERVEGVGLLLCFVCGHVQEIEFQEGSDGEGTPLLMEDEDGTQGSDTEGTQSGEGAGSDSGEDGEGESGEPDQPGGQEDRAGEAGRDDADSSDDADGVSDKRSGEGTSGLEGWDRPGASGGGASHSGAGNDVAQSILDSAETDDSGLKTVQQALSDAFYELVNNEQDLDAGEKPWMPYDTSLDEAMFAKPRSSDNDQERANIFLESMSESVAFMQARFRSLMRAKEMTEDEHGVPRGTTLSERNLITTYLEILDGKRPTRPYKEPGEQIETSIRTVISLDQSASTRKIYPLLQKLMLAITAPVENIGGQVMAFGWRFNRRQQSPPSDDRYLGLYHRYDGVTYDIFKTFGERFANVKWRFVNSSSTGGTPMADGMEFGLRILSEAPEAHRVLVMITDGKPPKVLLPVLRQQLRRAKEAGIHVLAVATGEESRPRPTPRQPDPLPYVAQIFDDWVFDVNPANLHVPIVQKFSKIFDRTERKRGRRLRRS